MDPNKALSDLFRMARLVEGTHHAGRMDELPAGKLLLDMAERFLALDAWLARGGYLPLRWHLPQALKRG
jgi:hypothetical protein